VHGVHETRASAIEPKTTGTKVGSPDVCASHSGPHNAGTKSVDQGSRYRGRIRETKARSDFISREMLDCA
jgi:hypothetical protein